MEITELEKQVLKQEYPQVSLSDDLDIERYFELRKTGHLNEALLLYNGKLKRKYPDDSMRYELMSSYRLRSHRFQELLTANLISLAQKTIMQIKQVIGFITERTANLDTNDVYNVIQECEKIVSAVSSDRFASISFTEKYARYADIIGFKQAAMKKSAELIRLYVTDTLSSVKAYRDEQDEILSRQKRERAAYRPPKTFDFSKIVFTKEQVNAIIISPDIKRVEDQVIAYTLKYWPVYADGGFENIVLLYSRKYRTNNFNIFQAVKIGRFRSWRDEEILQAVLLNLVNGYYYSISGDLYLQREWARVKVSIEPVKKKEELIDKTSDAEAVLEKKVNQKKEKKTTDKKTEKVDLIKAEKVRRKKSTDTKTESLQKDAVFEIKKAKTEESNLENTLQNKKSLPEKKNDKLKKPELEKNKLKKEELKNDSVKEENLVELQKEESKSEAYFERPKLEMNPSGSISEMIKTMRGDKYQIHKGLFFEGIRPSIRKVLEKSAVQKISMFGNEQNDAENYIYDFFDQNYDNPYQNWGISEQRVQVLKLGFDIKTVEPIIADWIKGLKF
ncbi:hypothetical protein HO345_08745 [Treponema denticola]|uniref:Uncharacterized protein n=1 Tax=Treponema denticola SP33 TaxID=999437 RepID=M2BFR1_TREDN|nr:hypothetical protein [Treponema denticola]EMB28225.1 hypothetical protein HMPREF9733_00078 [Treponema denticola SP33]EPF36461.1 hypothetical protein HMPREF9732_01830 [Treponema denticola SP32]UTD13065.1 hypothetical protein HO345_08745 [Treponema denticola]